MRFEGRARAFGIVGHSCLQKYCDQGFAPGPKGVET